MQLVQSRLRPTMPTPKQILRCWPFVRLALMDLDAALASEIFGISWPPSGVGWGHWVRTGEGEITFTYTGDQGELTYICGDWPGYAVGESLDAGELCWLGHGAGEGLELDSATRVE